MALWGRGTRGPDGSEPESAGEGRAGGSVDHPAGRESHRPGTPDPSPVSNEPSSRPGEAGGPSAPTRAHQASRSTGAENRAARDHDGRGPRFLHGVWIAVREVVIVVGLALVLAFVAKTWFVQSFYIPSGSMLNTLAEDDRVLVSKLTPGPFDVRRGDIVVFEDPAHWLPERLPASTQSGWRQTANTVLTWVGLLPSDSGNHLIKRVIGLPGDRVACCSTDGRLTVNGAAVSEPYLFPGDPPSSLPFEITVPEGKLWVMGDHRSNSSDSRYNDNADRYFNRSDEATATDKRNGTGYYGSVPIDRVVGKAFAVILPLSKVGTLNTPDETFATVPAPSPSSPTPTPRATGRAR